MKFLFQEQKIKSSVKNIGHKRGKHGVLLFQDGKGAYDMKIIVVNDVLAHAELHEKSVDLWYVIKGKGVFIIGGTLKDGVREKQHEWVAPAIRGGRRYAVKPGDAIEIPAGTPHQTDARHNSLVMAMVKINL